MGCMYLSVLLTLLLQFYLVQSQQNGDFQLSGCSGTVEVYRTALIGGSRFFDICDRNFGDEEAQVVCRQFGCNPVGARRTRSGPGFVSFFVREGYSCGGSESSLSSCQRTSATCSVGSTITSENQGDFVTVTCGPSPPSEPRDLAVDVLSASALNVTWNRPQRTNNGGSVTTYQILLDDSVITTLNIDLFSSFRLQNYLIRDLDESTTYTIQVKGGNNGGFGPAATATATTQSLSEPQIILDPPQVENRGARVFVSWEFPGGTVDAYIIEYTRLINTEAIRVSVNGSETSTYIDNLLPGSYELRLAVENENGLSAFGPTSFFEVSSVNNGNSGGSFGGNNGVTTTVASVSVLLVSLFTWASYMEF